MVDGGVLHLNLVAAAGVGEHVARLLSGGCAEIGIKIMPADLILTSKIVRFGHELIFCLPDGRAGERQLAARAVRQGYLLEKILRHRTQQAGRYLVIRKRISRYRIDYLFSEAGEVPIP